MFFKIIQHLLGRWDLDPGDYWRGSAETPTTLWGRKCLVLSWGASSWCLPPMYSHVMGFKGGFKWALGPMSFIIALGKTSDEFIYQHTDSRSKNSHEEISFFHAQTNSIWICRVDLDTFSICICIDGPIDVWIYQKITPLPPGQGLQAHCDYPWYWYLDWDCQVFGVQIYSWRRWKHRFLTFLFFVFFFWGGGGRGGVWNAGFCLFLSQLKEFSMVLGTFCWLLPTQIHAQQVWWKCAKHEKLTEVIQHGSSNLGESCFFIQDVCVYIVSSP